jgi:flagellar biosynthesis protein FlhF
MQTAVPFLARSAAEAFLEIQEKMGPDAVVLDVRSVPARGWTRWWRKPQVEVLALPPAAEPSAVPSTPESLPPPQPSRTAALQAQLDLLAALPAASLEPSAPGQWKIASMLQQGGLLPLVSHRLMEEVEAQFGKQPPASLAEETIAVRETLRQLWRVAGAPDLRRPQVLIGAPGSGKTTFLCKWLAKSVLCDGKLGRVCRLDGVGPNVGAILDMHARSMGVEVDRSLASLLQGPSEICRWVDIPGVDGRDVHALGELRRVLDKITGAEVHLVLNGAYEVPVLLAQIRAYSSFPLSGLIVTHLDEETRWSKLWNLVLGASLALRFIGLSRNASGGLLEATPELLNQRWLGPSESMER